MNRKWCLHTSPVGSFFDTRASPGLYIYMVTAGYLTTNGGNLLGTSGNFSIIFGFCFWFCFLGKGRGKELCSVG